MEATEATTAETKPVIGLMSKDVASASQLTTYSENVQTTPMEYTSSKAGEPDVPCNDDGARKDTMPRTPSYEACDEQMGYPVDGNKDDDGVINECGNDTTTIKQNIHGKPGNDDRQENSGNQDSDGTQDNGGKQIDDDKLDDNGHQENDNKQESDGKNEELSVTSEFSEEGDTVEDIANFPFAIVRRTRSPNMSDYGAQYTDDSMGDFYDDETEKDTPEDQVAFKKINPSDIRNLTAPGFAKLAGRQKEGRNVKQAEAMAKIEAFYSVSKLKGAFPDENVKKTRILYG